MLVAEFVVQLVLDFRKVGVGLAGDRNGLCLVFAGVCFDEVLEGVIVDVICITKLCQCLVQTKVDVGGELKPAGRRMTTYGGSILALIPSRGSLRTSYPRCPSRHAIVVCCAAVLPCCDSVASARIVSTPDTGVTLNWDFGVWGEELGDASRYSNTGVFGNG